MKISQLMALATLSLSLLACGGGGKVTQAPEPDEPVAWMQANAQTYLHDRLWRRARLEETLWRPDLPYAQKLLENYALERGGWDLLPVLDFQIAPLIPGDTDVEFEPLMRVEPTTREEWLELGERAFWTMPMRRDAYLEWVSEQPEVWDELGLEQREDGSLRGFVRYIDPRGRQKVGITCGLCHGAGGEAGKANRAVDLGRARALFMTSRGLSGEPFESWGRGKLDVTSDNVNDPVAIPNLWAASQQRYYNASGVVRVVTPASAAVRFETQYIINHSYEARPHRALPWALGMYVMGLQAPQVAHEQQDIKEGSAIFAARCAGCHLPERGYSGELVDASALISDARIAHSLTRGTGSYRVPGLRGISQGGPYLHDASAATLEELLELGHPSGEALGQPERVELLRFLRTL